MHKEIKMTRRATCLVIILMVGLIIISVPNVAFAKRSKVVYQGKSFYKWAKGYSGGIDKNGISMPTGGAVWWTDKGGPKVSFSFGAGYGYGSVGLGISSSKGTRGQFVKIPATKHFYKVYVKKQVKYRKYKVYVWRYDPRVKRERWVYSSKGVKNLGVTARQYYAKRVCPNGAHHCKKGK